MAAQSSPATPQALPMGGADGEDSDSVGGLVGKQNGGSITTSYAAGTVDGGAGGDNIGGLVGRQREGSIISSYATSAADGGAGDTDKVGGLVGKQASVSIISSYATGTANGGAGNTDKVGGLVGEQNGSSSEIIFSYATGAANGDVGISDSVGGLVGEQAGGLIISSYATGTANGGEGDTDLVGSLVGLFQSPGARITASYGFGMPTGETDNSATVGKPPVVEANALTAPGAGVQWNGTNSPWKFGSSQPPVLAFITGASVSGTNVTYKCERPPATAFFASD